MLYKHVLIFKAEILFFFFLRRTVGNTAYAAISSEVRMLSSEGIRFVL